MFIIKIINNSLYFQPFLALKDKEIPLLKFSEKYLEPAISSSMNFKFTML